MLNVEHSHQVAIHHGNTGFLAGVLGNFAIYANSSALVYPADFYLSIFLHLLVHFLLVIGDDVWLTLKTHRQRQKDGHGAGHPYR